MESSEQILGIIESLVSDSFLDYNLVLTTRRIVLVRSRDLSFPELGLAENGLFGWNPDTSTLNELLQKDEHSYAINYREIEKIKLHKGFLNDKLVLELWGSQKIFFFDGNFKKICALLLRVSALEGRISISK